MNNAAVKAKLLPILGRYVPDGTAERLVDWIVEHKVLLKITPPRKSILGNYYHPNKNRGHVITVNGDLNLYAFFVTLVHELAHMEAWLKHRNRVPPHGDEWKNEFRQLMLHFLRSGFLPDDIERALQAYLHNPAAASCTDENLSRALKRYNATQAFTVDQMPENALFLYGNRLFRKGPRLRKRFKCVDVNTRRMYLFSPLAEVCPVEPEPF